MPSILRILSFTVIPASGLLVALLVPKLEFAGVFRTAENQNNEQCVALPGLEACEDAFVHDATGTAYLVCSDIKTRQQWLPAMLHLDATALPVTSTDYIALYSFNTNDHSRLALTGQPAGHTGIYVHAIDIFQTPNTDVLTLFINSHRPPTDRSKGAEGANSVVEMYETTVGSTEAKYVGEVEDLKLRTPNNLVAMSERTFYASNDHLRKNHWRRKLEALVSEPSDIVYCDANAVGEKCIVAADGLIYPNGILKGPGSTIYSASSLAGNIRIWETQADHTLVLLDEVTLPRPTDNIHATTKGAVLAATFPKILELLTASSPAGVASGHKSPVEVWKMSNETSSEAFYGKKYNVERIFADDGGIVSSVTAAAPYGDKILLTGVMTKQVVVCTLPPGTI